MAVDPINISRITHNMRANSIVSSLQRNQLDLFTTQAKISSGRSFLTPSEDPIAAARTLDLTQALGLQEQFSRNLTHGDNVLAAADEAITEINTLLIEANAIASQNVGSLTSPAERSAEAELIAGIREQLMIVGNRQFEGRYIFAGRDTLTAPFVDAFGGVRYQGDTGDLFTRVSEEFWEIKNIPGSALFGALSSRIASDADLTPSLNDRSRLEDVSGARGEPILRGTLIFNEVGGAGVFQVDLQNADTIGDVVRLINDRAAAAGASVTAALTSTGIEITPGSSDVSVTDSSAGAVAANLGILTSTPTGAVITGEPLTPRLTMLTDVTDLAHGAGVDTQSGFIISNGSRSVTVDLSNAQTVQDIINIINHSDVGVRSQINEEGSSVDVFNEISGTSLTVGENGGTTATDLGIRTLDTATPLSALNFERGFETKEGEDDLQIIAKNGSSVSVNLDDARTIGDVIDLINEAATDAGVSIAASFTGVGNGIQIEDTTGGSGSLSIQSVNASPAASDLGLVGSVDDPETVLVGADANPTRTEGILGALIDLESALRRDDTPGIALAAARLDRFTPEVTRMHGIVGARSQSMRTKLVQMQDAARTTEIHLSEVRDLDFAEAATKMQSAITQLQASFQTSSILFNLSLMDFIR